jgi:hypothetical protein
MIPTSLSDAVAIAASHVPLVVLLVKATIILVAALGITLAMQRASAGARHLVWLVTLATLLIMPALTAWGPLPLRVLPAAPTRATESARTGSSPRATPTPAAAPAASEVAAASPTTPASAVSSATTFLNGMSGIALVLAVWGAVVLSIAASLVWSALTVRRIVRRSHALDAPEWLTPLWEVADRLGLDEAPRLLRSEEAKMPFACGLLTPTIVLPADCEEWTLDQRERARVRRPRAVVRHAGDRLRRAPAGHRDVGAARRHAVRRARDGAPQGVRRPHAGHPRSAAPPRGAEPWAVRRAHRHPRTHRGRRRRSRAGAASVFRAGCSSGRHVAHLAGAGADAGRPVVVRG